MSVQFWPLTNAAWRIGNEVVYRRLAFAKNDDNSTGGKWDKESGKKRVAVVGGCAVVLSSLYE